VVAVAIMMEVQFAKGTVPSLLCVTGGSSGPVSKKGRKTGYHE